MENRYSLVISLPDDIIELVRQMKLDLAEEIGWFHSKNSLAHITINEFKASSTVLESIVQKISTICEHIQPITVRFNEFGSFPNGAFYIAPNLTSTEKLKEILNTIHQSFTFETVFTNDEPHISIARRLKPHKLAKAFQFFAAGIELNFICDSLSLRQFNPKLKQFEIINYFPFKANYSASKNNH